MNGFVDEANRALVEVAIANKWDAQGHTVTVWVDTAFDGHLVLSLELIERFDLESLVETEAILADGSKVSLETFLCYIDWFGERLPIQVIANEGKYPLLGTLLLAGRRLCVDYSERTLEMT